MRIFFFFLFLLPFTSFAMEHTLLELVNSTTSQLTSTSCSPCECNDTTPQIVAVSLIFGIPCLVYISRLAFVDFRKTSAQRKEEEINRLQHQLLRQQHYAATSQLGHEQKINECKLLLQQATQSWGDVSTSLLSGQRVRSSSVELDVLSTPPSNNKRS